MKRFTTAFSLVLISTAAPVWAQEEPSEMQHEYQGEFVSVDRDVDQEDGVTIGTVAVQTNNGNGAIRTFERGVDEANQSAARSSQITTNAGQTLASGASANCDGNGTCSANRSATGPNGDKLEANRSISQTVNGFARSGGVTGPQGLSAATQGSAGYSSEVGVQRGSARTGPQGNSVSSEGSAQCANSACNRFASQVGPQGQGRAVNNTTALGEFGGVKNTRNVTAPNGQTRTQSRVGRARLRPR